MTALLKSAGAVALPCYFLPVGRLRFGDEIMEIGGGKIGEISQKLYDTVTGIQLGKYKTSSAGLLK